MRLELVFKHKDTEQKQNYAYYWSKSKTYDVAVKEAEKYFTKLTRENGWTKKTTLTFISRLTNDQTPMDIVRVKPSPSKPRRSTSTARKTPSRKTPSRNASSRKSA